MSNQTTNQTLQEWQANAAYWVKYADILHSILSPVTEALITEAGIATRNVVLDVAGGAGEPSLTIAETVGPSGKAVCTDAVEEMLAHARVQAAKRGLTNIDFRHCFGDALPFDDGTFDVVVCRLGIMFFPDPGLALREMLRVTKAGGTIALVVWQKSELNPFCGLPTKVMSRHVETTPADPDGPGAFRFAEHGKLARLVLEAGAVDVREQVLEFQLEGPLSFSEFWEMRSHTSSGLREQLSKVPSDEKLVIEKELREEVADYFTEGRMNFPASMIVVSGRKL